jgi:hypothetical protein
MIDKKKIDQNNATNTSAAISAIGTMIAAINGIVYHRDFGDWMPVVLLGGASAFAQWLQGTPSARSQLVASVLRLDGAVTNAQLIRSAIDRLLTSGIVPGLNVSQPETMQPSIRPRRLGVTDQARAIANQMEQRLADRQRPQSSQPMNRDEWMQFSRGEDDRYPKIVQTGFDPDEIGPSTTAR